MDPITIKIRNSSGAILGECSGADTVNLVYRGVYREGDVICLSAPDASFLVIQLDDVMNPAFVYLAKSPYVFMIPFGEKRLSYNPKAFTGEVHLLTARPASKEEIAVRKNLAQNEYDTNVNPCCYPHASANVETRNESVFAARNAIDGNTANHSHGNWPYESWGINCDPNAAVKIDFGRAVSIDRIVLVTRADFPHDNWWKQAALDYSDGTSEILSMKKSDLPHSFDVRKTGISWIRLHSLIPCENDPSPFPALTQVLVFGRESK